MKLSQPILLIVFLGLFVSCEKWSKRENRRLMQQAQLLTELKPDSALMLLDSVNTTLLSDTEKAEYILLRVQTRDNARLDLSTDIEIFQVREFFINRKDWEKAALACLYAGKVVDEKDDVMQEMGYYSEGFELAKMANNELLQGKILYNMGYLKFDRLWYSDAITQYRQAINIFRTANNERQHDVYLLISIAQSFTLEQKADSTQHYFDAALQKAQMLDDNAMQALVYNKMMEAYMELKLLDAAKYWGRQALTRTTADMDKADIFKNFAQIFLEQNLLDSAKYYIVEAESFIAGSNNLYELANFYYVYYEIEKEAGNYPKAMEYYELYANCRIKLTDWNDLQKRLEVQKQYDIANKENRYFKEKVRIWRFTGILAMIALALIFVVILMRNRQKKALSKTKLEKNEAEQKLEMLYNMYHKRNNEIQVAFLEKVNIIKEMTLLNTQNTSPVRFIAEVNALISRFTTQKFVDITNELYPGFTDKLKDNFPNANLSELETGVCCLIVCGFTNKELAFVIYGKKDTHTVEKLKNRIRKKLDIPAYNDIQKFLLDEIVGK